MTLKEILIK